jgi:hexulose-6-phosphate isomerase
MNKREFIKSAAVIAGATAVRPLSSAVIPLGAATVAHGKSGQEAGKVTLKKSLGFGMINKNLSLTDKFKLAVDLGFHGVELNSPIQ